VNHQIALNERMDGKKAFVWIDKIDQSLADNLYLPFSFVQDRFEQFLHDKKTPEIFNYTYSWH